MFEAFELCVQLMMPGVENGDLENESGHAHAEAGNGQISLPEHFSPYCDKLKIINQHLSIHIKALVPHLSK